MPFTFKLLVRVPERGKLLRLRQTGGLWSQSVSLLLQLKRKLLKDADSIGCPFPFLTGGCFRHGKQLGSCLEDVNQWFSPLGVSLPSSSQCVWCPCSCEAREITNRPHLLAHLFLFSLASHPTVSVTHSQLHSENFKWESQK